LLIDNVDELEKWLEKDGSTDQELAYWIPKYILMRGDKPFADMGAMTPRMKTLAQSQDKIGYCNFMEGYISILSIWQCPAASSMVPTGQNNLSQKSSTSRTPNGYSATSHSMTIDMDTSSRRRLTR
jgi:hypothetical protein